MFSKTSLIETFSQLASRLGEEAGFFQHDATSLVQNRLETKLTGDDPMLTRRSLIGLLAATPLLARPAFAASPEVFVNGGAAINGIDPVAYFDGAGPVAGSADNALMWKGAEWRFASADNRSKFEMDPEAFAPQYGGYCAYALSKGSLASTDPEAWSIHEGKLYLNYSVNVRKIWSEDIPGNIAKADANWPGVLA